MRGSRYQFFALFALLLAAPALSRRAGADPPFIQSAYLWTQATDADLGGSGDWGMYRAWLGVSRLGAESDPGGWGRWSETAEGDYNNHWGEQQIRYGTMALPEILLGIGAMPYDPAPGATWEQKLKWEDRQWQLEANNDPAVMQHFVKLGNNLVDWHYKSVILRMDYEFDGGWDPYGNLNVMGDMPNRFIKAWRNIVSTVRKTVAARDPKVRVRFLWNPTDGNVQVESAKFYPGDAYVDFIGFDNYDSDYSGIYKPGVQPDAATQERAWTNSILPRIQRFSDFASAAGSRRRNGGVPGRSVPLIVGEWGLWQTAANGRGAGGDDPGYIQHMYDWMRTHNVYMESYFETPADGISTLWPGGFPKAGSGNHSWGAAGSPYPKAAAKYRELFGGPRAEPGYTLVDLGVSSDRVAIGATGSMAGSAKPGSGRGVHAARWTATTATDLGTLGGRDSHGLAINGAGQVAGYSFIKGDIYRRAVFWTDAQMTNISPPGSRDSRAYAINESGQIAGVFTPSGRSVEHAFRAVARVFSDLGTLGGAGSSGLAINGRGDVTGCAALAGGALHAVLWTGPAAVDLGALSGGSSCGMAINDSGQVAGYYINEAGVARAALWTDRNGADIGTLGGPESKAYGIDAAGDVVGYAVTRLGYHDAFLYTNGHMTDLNRFVRPGSGWQLTDAYGINDHGWIVGIGTFHGDSHAFLLKPQPGS